MASRLLSAGHPVRIVAHRNRAPIDRLRGRGATESPDIAAAVSGAGIILSCLPNSGIVDAVVEEASGALRPDTLWIDATTGDPAVARRLSERLAGIGVVFADAPVTGGPAQAGAGELTSLVGCDAPAFPAVERIVGAYSGSVLRMGEPGAGTVAKLFNNHVTQGTMVLLGQAFRTARPGDDPPPKHE